MPLKRNKRSVIKNFNRVLISCIETNSDITLSATALANAFNLRADGTTTISRQTARKWLNGESIPEPGHLLVLVEWLEIDMNKVYKRTDDV